jgi:hypothetical protein
LGPPPVSVDEQRLDDVRPAVNGFFEANDVHGPPGARENEVTASRERPVVRKRSVARNLHHREASCGVCTATVAKKDLARHLMHSAST